MSETETMSSDEMNAIALDVIMQAGDARQCVSEALKAAASGNYAKFDANLEEAKKLIALAHRKQTDIVQSEGDGNKHEHTLLFIHAQDTLMVVYSEMNMARQIKAVFEGFEKRIAALEEKAKNG